jgi:beta-lactam-binding protein with PASTA domain
MKRFFTFVLGALAMVAVALISAFVAMRLAIHGREAAVPNLSGLTVSDAAAAAASQGLDLTLENHFYSADVPAGHVLAQDPPAGFRVRHEWPVRITESLGPQRVNIPDLTGQSERAATVGIRRLTLELGTVAHLAIAGDPDVVLTQTPPANAGGVDGPRVSLLVSDALPDDAQPRAYVMPSLVGLSTAAASARAASAGLRLVVSPDAAVSTLGSVQNGQLALSPPAVHSVDIVVAQSPQPGRRVLQGDAVHVTISRTLPPTTAPAASQ